MPRLRTLLTGSACALLLSCSSPTSMCACPPSRTHGVVYGTVRSAAGQPVAGARVQAEAFHSVCGEGFGEVDRGADPVSSNAAGAYRLHFYSVGGPRSACVRVTARKAAAADSTTVNAALVLRHERQTPDSVRVDLVLP